MSAYENPEDARAFRKRICSKVSIEDIRAAYIVCCRGSSFRYHTGFLAMDAENNEELTEIRQQINAWVVMGTITISQKKLADYSYEYYARLV